MQASMSYESAPQASTPAVGGIRRRFVALMVDGLVLGVIQSPVSIGVGIYAGVMAKNPGLGAAELTTQQLALQGASWVFSLLVAYFYYGWFYKNKGATPGKLLLGLRVVDVETGTHISYGKAFLRETVGRVIDMVASIFLFAGLLVPVFRKDKRALHDFIAGTQVLRR